MRVTKTALTYLVLLDVSANLAMMELNAWVCYWIMLILKSMHDIIVHVQYASWKSFRSVLLLYRFLSNCNLWLLFYCFQTILLNCYCCCFVTNRF